MKEKLSKEESGFAQIKNEVLQDKNLSLRAKGLFAYLYSKPNHWDFSGDRIAKETNEGRRVIYNALKDLEKMGYLRRKRINNGRMEYHITYKPLAQNSQEPLAQKRKVPKTQSAEMSSISNIVSNTNKDKEINKDKYCELSSQVNEIFNIFYKINPTINWGNKTSRSAAEFMIKKFGFEGVKKMAEQIIAVQGQEYCPVATTPYQMKEKLAKFKIFFNGKNNNNQNKGIRL